MKNGFTFFGHVNADGQLRIYNKDIFERKIALLAKTHVEIEIVPRTDNLQHNWRSYYFGIVVKQWQDLLFYLGESKSLHDVDYMLRSLFLYKEIYDEKNDIYHRELHTLRDGDTEIGAPRFKHYVQQCIQLAAEMDWQIPLPGELIED